MSGRFVLVPLLLFALSAFEREVEVQFVLHRTVVVGQAAVVSVLGRLRAQALAAHQQVFRGLVLREAAAQVVLARLEALGFDLLADVGEEALVVFGRQRGRQVAAARRLPGEAGLGGLPATLVGAAQRLGLDAAHL